MFETFLYTPFGVFAILSYEFVKFNSGDVKAEVLVQKTALYWLWVT